MHKDSIYFIHPTRDLGGAPLLFARMAQYLIENTTREVVLVDFRDGFIRNRLKDFPHRFIEFNDGEKVTIEEPTIIVQFLSHLPFINRRLSLAESTRLFFWDMHPYNLVEQLALSGIYKRLSATTAHALCSLLERKRRDKLARFVEYGTERRGIVFMAERNRLYNQELLGFACQAEYLPIPINTDVLSGLMEHSINTDVNHTIHIGWLSRLDSWKTSVLFRLLDDVDAYTRNHGPETIHLHIIGDGPKRSDVQARCAGLSASVVGRLEDAALTEYMLAHLHVGFAMGTSALEFAVRGLPTVLTSGGMSHDNLNNEKIYRWLFNSQGYNVAAEETTRPLGLRTFSDVVSDLRNFGVKDLGDRSQNYAVENHGIKNVGASFVNFLDQCTLTYGDLERLGIFHFTPYEQALFGLKRIYKQWT